MAPEGVQWSACVDMKEPVAITPFACRQDEFDGPDTQTDPDFFRNAPADGMAVGTA